MLFQKSIHHANTCSFIPEIPTSLSINSMMVLFGLYIYLSSWESSMFEQNPNEYSFDMASKSSYDEIIPYGLMTVSKNLGT